MSISLCELNPNAKFVITNEIPSIFLQPKVLEQVEANWQKKLIDKPTMFDGKILVCSGLTRDGATLFPSSYKFFLTLRDQPELFLGEAFFALAVSGLVTFGGKILMGKRATVVTQEPGLWEFGPSGGIDPSVCLSGTQVSLLNQFLLELQEETGLENHHVLNTQISHAITDPKACTADVIVKAELSNIDGLKTATHEYSEISFMKLAEITEFSKLGQLCITSSVLLKEIESGRIKTFGEI